MKWHVLLLLACASAATVICAHKAPPLSKDRISPKLQRVAALNNRQILYTFSEVLDTLQLSKNNFVIRHGDDTIGITMIYPSLSAAEIMVITDVQLDSIYTTSGYVFDTAHNKTNFEYSFPGTSQPDTIAPWITRYARGHGQRGFSFTFSEPMDTIAVEFVVLPGKNLKPVWQGQRQCRFIPATATDSLHADTTYYLFVDEGFQDVSGQKIKTFITHITPDTIYKPLTLQGTAKIEDSLVDRGFAILERTVPIGIAVMNNGTFSFEVRDSTAHTVHVLSDGFYGAREVWSDSTNIIPLHPEEISIDSLLH